MRAIVTGAAGFIGSHLSGHLLDHGDEVVGIDSLTDYYDPRLKEANLATLEGREGFTLHRMDLTSAPLARLFEQADVVYHLAGQPGVRTSFGRGLERYLADNVLATELLLGAAEEVGVRRVVFASSSSVYGSMEEPATEDQAPSPASPYGVTKLACEHLCRLSPVDCVALRYFTVYGPGQRPDMAFSRFIAAIRAGDPVSVYGDGTQIRDFTYVGDAVAATIAAGRLGSGTYNIAGGSQVSLNEALRMLGSLIGDTLWVKHTAAVAGDVRCTSADTTRARRDLGYAPSTTLEQGLARQING